MTYIKFTDSQNLIPCEIISQDNIVTLKFQDNVVVDTSGFQVFLDKKGEYDISGNSYLNFKTIYRNDSITEKYNGYQLSNDGFVYKEPIVEPKPIEPTPTEEEIKEREQQNKILELNNQISALKTQLAETDYIFTKNYELMLVGKTTIEYDFEKIHIERQEIRNQINEMEKNLKTLMEETL